jgi:hypothetical protein
MQVGELMSEQNSKYITKKVGKLLSEVWRIRGWQNKKMAQITLSRVAAREILKRIGT